MIELKRGGRVRVASGRWAGRGWHAAYVVAMFLMAVTTDDKPVRFLLTATAVGSGYSLGRKSQRERDGA